MLFEAKFDDVAVNDDLKAVNLKISCHIQKSLVDKLNFKVKQKSPGN
jgi:hypothetical protein